MMTPFGVTPSGAALSPVMRTGADTDRVITRLSSAPWWVLALVAGCPFGAVMTVFSVVRGSFWPAAVIGGAVSGIAFGSIMSWWLTRQRAAQRVALETLAPSSHRSAARAVTRGPAPADPQVRAAAARMTSHRLELLRRQRPWALPLSGAGTLGYVAAALMSSPWWWVAAAFFAAMLALTLREPGRLRRRLIDLTTTTPQ